EMEGEEAAELEQNPKCDKKEIANEEAKAGGVNSGVAQNSAKNEGNNGKSPFVLQGGVTYTVPRGTPIKLKLAGVPSHPMNLVNRDLDGNLYPAKLGEQISARISEDI